MTSPSPSPQLSGPKVLLEGPSGTGKTYALGKLVDWAGAQTPPKRVFVLFAENGLETLLGYWRDRDLPIPANLYWHSLVTKPLSLKSLLNAADMVGKLSYESVAKMVDSERSKNNAFHAILTACSNFPDDRTGKTFGAIDAFTPDDIFAIDSLSEVSAACMRMVIGSKPTASQPDYGVAQNNLMNFLRLCTQGLRCTFVLTAHVDRIQDELTGGMRIMTKSIGKAPAGDIPQLFSDVIYTVREGDRFYWDTANPMVDLKTRSLKIASKLPPDFGIVMDVWLKRGASPA